MLEDEATSFAVQAGTSLSIYRGGGHAGYRLYPCKDGRVAVVALEPHFAAALCAAAGVPPDVFAPATHAAIAAFMAARTRVQLDALAVDKDIPLHTMAA